MGTGSLLKNKINKICRAFSKLSRNVKIRFKKKGLSGKGETFFRTSVVGPKAFKGPYYYWMYLLDLGPFREYDYRRRDCHVVRTYSITSLFYFLTYYWRSLQIIPHYKYCKAQNHYRNTLFSFVTKVFFFSKKKKKNSNGWFHRRFQTSISFSWYWSKHGTYKSVQCFGQREPELSKLLAFL